MASDFLVDAFAGVDFAVDAPAFFVAGEAGAPFGAADVVARATADRTDFTVERTAEPTRDVVDRDGAGSGVAAALDVALEAAFDAVFEGAFARAGVGGCSAGRGVAWRAAVFLAVVPLAPVLPDAALLATIGPRPFVAHAVVVDKWGRQ